MIIREVADKNIFGKTVNVIAVNVLRYDLEQDNCVLRYELRFRDPNRESSAVPDVHIAGGEWKVPENILNAWTGSNHYLVETMCEEFNFELL